MKQKLITAMFAAFVFAIAGGCASLDPDDYRLREPPAVHTVTYGTVESVRPARVGDDRSFIGAVTGAAVGGLIGNSIGHGNGRGVATVLGAVGGGIAGDAIENRVTERAGEEIVVRLDNGTTIAVVQAGSQGFEPGQRVRVLSGAKGSRVERA